MTNIIQADLTGKTVLITGASYGLGAHYAQLLANNHATVVVSGREKSYEQILTIVEKINKDGGKALPLILDLQEIDSFEEKITDIIKKIGHLDILINNAAVSIGKSFFEVSPELWDQQMNTNVKGLFFLSQAVANKMKDQKFGGTIINIAAVNGEKVRKNSLVYGTTKAAVIQLTKYMAYELIDYKVRVNAISLGLFASEPVQQFLENDASAKDYLARIPLKRAGLLNELDGPMLLLASDAASYMNGSIIKVDGGFCIDVFMNTSI